MQDLLPMYYMLKEEDMDMVQARLKKTMEINLMPTDNYGDR